MALDQGDRRDLVPIALPFVVPQDGPELVREAVFGQGETGAPGHGVEQAQGEGKQHRGPSEPKHRRRANFAGVEIPSMAQRQETEGPKHDDDRCTDREAGTVGAVDLKGDMVGTV